MKKLLVLLVIVIAFSSCSPRRHVFIPLAPAEKVVIIEREANMMDGMLRYKVKRINSSTVTYIQISYLTEYEPKDTLLWRF